MANAIACRDLEDRVGVEPQATANKPSWSCVRMVPRVLAENRDDEWGAPFVASRRHHRHEH
jgi:hypothetical protein